MSENRIKNNLPEDDDKESSGSGNFLTTLQTFDQLPDEMKSIVMTEAGRLTESFQGLTQEALEIQKKQNEDEDPIGALFYPLMLEMAFHKIQLGAVSSAISDIVNNRDPNENL